MNIMIPLWYVVLFALSAAYLGFWYGRSRNWPLLETDAAQKSTVAPESSTKNGVRRVRLDHLLVSPTNGKTDAAEEENQIRILTTDNRLYAPADGRILKIDPRGNAFLLQTDWGDKIWVGACVSRDDLLDRYFRPRVVRGEIVRAGKLLLEYDREMLCRLCDDTAVFLSWETTLETQRIFTGEEIRLGEALLSFPRQEISKVYRSEMA